jgi:cob(I)alamin adenosyltransferase
MGMPRLDRITTRRGDKGQTTLGDGLQVSKAHPRIALLGEIDALNAHLGWVLAVGVDPALSPVLQRVQQFLFQAGSDVCFPDKSAAKTVVPVVRAEYTTELEQAIDRWNAELRPLENFILPGGAPGAAALHVARTFCRSAERHAVALNESEALNPELLRFLNRLSDLLFVFARVENKLKSGKEPLWDPHL